MKKKVLINILVPVMLLGIGIFFIVLMTSDKVQDTAYHFLFTKNYRVFAPQVPDKMDFAGEKVPLDLYYVRESLDREILAGTFMHSSTIQMFKRANRWFPVIEPILKKNNIPDDFKYLALAESNLGNVVSPTGAEGFWQFVRATAVKYGLEVNEEVDERYNVEKSTEAACEYLKDAYIEYGNWTLAAASFNRGMDGISKALENQQVKSYYDLFVVDETARYIYRILAIKQVYLHPVQYGFYLRQSDFYPALPYTTVTVDSAIKDLPAFALKMKINYKILREFNPWIKRYNLPNKTGKTYTFKLPKEGALDWDLLQKANPETNVFFNDTLRIDQVN
ncbi:MAG TPA: lytic transglycosylase domain-containing protein [Bacteroidales bacterium]|nr:lytic transglycosylase domain-containing protein [Bacteroidales bacterium]